MWVYVLISVWDNPDNSGFDVVGVYSEENLLVARATMRSEAAKVRAEYGKDFVWSSDFSEETEDLIRFGFDPMCGYTCATVYEWRIEKRVLN